MKNKRFKLPIDSIDIRELLEDLNIDYSERGKNVSGGWIGVQCPFCDDSSNHLGVNIASKTVSCFKCGKSGTIIQYLSQELNSFKKAISIIEESIPRELKRFNLEMEYNDVEKVELPVESVRGLLPSHAKFLKKRRFNGKALSEAFNLHSVGPVGEWKNKIIVPIVKNYRLVTFTSIDISDNSDNRYIHLSDDKSIIHIKQLLFGSEYTNGHSVVVTEGIFDTWRFHHGAVPLWGTKFTDKQLELLSKFSYVKIVGDGDKAGYKFNRDLSTALAPFCEVKYFDLDEGVDPDKLNKAEIKHIKNN